MSSASSSVSYLYVITKVPSCSSALISFSLESEVGTYVWYLSRGVLPFSRALSLNTFFDNWTQWPFFGIYKNDLPPCEDGTVKE